MIAALLLGETASEPAASHVGDWQGAVPLIAVNSTAAEGCPIEAPDGLSLFIMSTRGAGGDQDIWVATRDDVDDEFGAPQELPSPVNSAANDFCPTQSSTSPGSAWRPGSGARRATSAAPSTAVPTPPAWSTGRP